MKFLADIWKWIHHHFRREESFTGMQCIKFGDKLKVGKMTLSNINFINTNKESDE